MRTIQRVATAGALGVLGAVAAIGAAFAQAAAAAPETPATPPLDTGHTAWMLTSTALVLMMTIPGVALFYAGMVRKKNVLATMMQSFAITCLVAVLWMIAAYSLAFYGNDAPFIGTLERFFMRGLTMDVQHALAPKIP
jgi:ammonium transporter, Amt family